jgi:uncharacterized protein YpbB
MDFEKDSEQRKIDDALAVVQVRQFFRDAGLTFHITHIIVSSLAQEGRTKLVTRLEKVKRQGSLAVELAKVSYHGRISEFLCFRLIRFHSVSASRQAGIKFARQQES